MEIAIYGKGGIGKSTVSGNLSAAMAMQGHRVLQIGCDPKHDSTQLLMHGKKAETVLSYLRRVHREEERAEAVLLEGAYGVGCIEAGGPEPGVGCAGRGIISAFEFLDRHRIKADYDRVVYDVLGDVVCGGFAVPVRRAYAQVIYLVTSGEFMAIYAANNILRGIRNFDGDTYCRVAGIIYNERRLTDEDGRVQRFARAVGLPIRAKVPRSDGFSQAEIQKRSLMELEGFGDEKAVFEKLARSITPDMKCYPARPLSDEELERVVLGNLEDGKTSAPFSLKSPEDRTGVKESAELSPEVQRGKMERRPPLYGCAFNGAATSAVHLTDAIVIAHGPAACGFYTMQNITSTGRKNLFCRGILMPSALAPHFESTDMGQAEAVFGGMQPLLDQIKLAVAKKPGAVIVISSCVSGIIGDDIQQTEALSTPQIPVIAIQADGVLAGDYMEGIRLCMDTLAARLIDPSVMPGDPRQGCRLVNLVNETGVSYHIAYNHRVIEEMLAGLDVQINCRYLGDATVSQMRNFLKAPLNLLASVSEDSLKRRRWLEDRYGCRFMDGGFPVGYAGTCRWLRRIGRFFDREKEAEDMISRQKRIYEEEIAALRPVLEGKKVLLTTINADLDWLLEAASDAGMRFVWIGVLNYLNQALCVTEHPRLCEEISSGYDWITIQEKIREKQPDLVLSNYTSVFEEGDYIQDAIPMMPAAGFASGLEVLRRWKKLLESPGKGGWKDDRKFFDTWYA